MAKFLVNVDLNKNELQNARIQNLATAPASPVIGQIYYDTALIATFQWNGTAWISFDASKVANGYIPLTKLATDPLARANHTGTQSVTTLTGILPTANGGTGIAFFTAAGPTVARVYTFPDAAATIARTDAGQTFVGVQTMASPTFTGVPIAPTAAANDSTTQLATTAFVTTADNLKANLASPTFTGIPAAPTATAGTNTTQLATTAFVTAADNLKANLASPTFTGTVTVPTPVNTTDAATKGYVDGVVTGLDIKQSVRVASTANIAVATALVNASVIDGVTVATGDRVLLKNQTTASENGIYVVVATGAASRATDADSSAEVTSGMYTYVSEGTANGTTGFALSTIDAITLGTTSLTFTAFSGAGQVIGGAGLVETGNTLDVVGTANRIVVAADSIDIGTDVVTLLGTQTLSNKTLVAPALGTVASGDVSAVTGTATNLTSGITNALKSATTTVNVSAATAPTAGQVLTASSGTVATWVTPTTGSVNKFAATIGDGTATSIAVTHSLNNADAMSMIRQVADNAVIYADVVNTNANVITFSFAVAPALNALRVSVMG